MPAVQRVGALHLLASRYPELALDVREVPDPLRWTHLPFEQMAHFGPPPEGMDLVTSVLARSERVLLGSLAYLEQHGVPASVAALADHRLVLWRCAGRSDDQLPRADGSWVPVEPWVVSSDAAVVVEAARQGLGLAFVPTLIATEAGLEAVLDAEIGDTVTLRISSQRPSRVRGGAVPSLPEAGSIAMLAGLVFATQITFLWGLKRCPGTLSALLISTSVPLGVAASHLVRGRSPTPIGASLAIAYVGLVGVQTIRDYRRQEDT